MDLKNHALKILKENKISTCSWRGQNFLISPKFFSRLGCAANLNKEDIILEVGAGLGFLTFYLAPRVKKVIAFEIDKNLNKYLITKIKEYSQVTLVPKNILSFPQGYFNKPLAYKVVANLPYNITGKFLRQIFSWNYLPQEMVLMLQREVAERIVAKPGKMNLLGLASQLYTKPRLLFFVGRKNFFPPPRVDSAVVKFSFLPRQGDEEKILSLARQGFAHPRKTLLNNLKMAGWKTDELSPAWQQLGLSLSQRPQDLSVIQWRQLAKSLLK